MQSHSARLYHLGGCEVSRSTLADANARRPSAVFQELFQVMAARANRGLRRATGEAVRLIDSTGLRLCGLASDWARFSTGVNGAKAHILYDPDAERPLYLQVTTAKVNDITIAKAMPIEPGATYVFDLGYYDYGWWAKLNETGSRIVTRLKKNTPLTTVKAQALPEGSALLYDRIGLKALILGTFFSMLALPLGFFGGSVGAIASVACWATGLGADPGLEFR